MRKPARLLNASILLVQALRIANAAAMLFFVAILVATLPGAQFVDAALIRKNSAARSILRRWCCSFRL
jgi:hypothetical protein